MCFILPLLTVKILLGANILLSRAFKVEYAEQDRKGKFSPGNFNLGNGLVSNGGPFA